MYDKSKKTWSQRLKITKTEKITTTTQTTTTAATAAAVTTPTTAPAAAANNAHSFGRSPTTQYQTATMHLPTLQLQRLNDYHNAGVGVGVGGGEYLPSALSRSMKYAEPWIYGTVRGIPARPYHHYMHQTVTAAPNYMHPHAAAIFATHPLSAAGGTAEALAVVICSCPEYLNGTKREVKKASVCKKCKGSRLPLAAIGGTMRLSSAAHLRSGAATMRVVSSSKKARPSILDPKLDPYDLMRRTRLLSPEPSRSAREESSSAKEKTRSRGKSASPVRGRSRKRSQPAPPPPKKQSSSSATEAVLPDCWLVEENEALLSVSGTSMASPSNSARRSILRCNVNPYDLISIKSSQTSSNANQSAPVATTPTTSTRSKRLSAGSSSQNEFIAPNDDFNVEDAALTEEAPPFAVSAARTPAAKSNHATALPKTTKATTATKARRDSRADSVERSKEAGSTMRADAAADQQLNAEETQSIHNYTNVQAIAGQRISLGERRSGKKALIKQSEDGRCYESIIIAADDVVAEHKDAKKSPPAAKQTRPQQLQVNKADEDRKRRAASTPPTESPPPPPKPTRTPSPAAAAAAQPKRPPRARKMEVSESVESDTEKMKSDKEETEEMENVTLLTVTPTQHIKSILKRPTSKSSECSDVPSAEEAKECQAAAKPGETSKSTTTPTNQRRANNVTSSNGSALSPTAKSQFYIPLPQATRKKVQFMVEERVIHALDDNKSGELSDDAADKQQQNTAHNEHHSSNNDVDEAAENVSAAQARKSTANYEYYNRKRERQRLLRQQNAHKITTTTTTTTTTTMDAESASPLGVEAQAQAALLAELQHESDLVSHALESRNNSDGSNKVYVDVEDLPTNGKLNVMHYEDVMPATTAKANTPHIAAHCNSSNKANISGNKIITDTTAKLLPTQCHAGGSQSQSTPSSTTTTTTTIAAVATLSPTSTTLTEAARSPNKRNAKDMQHNAAQADGNANVNDDADGDGDDDADVDDAVAGVDDDNATVDDVLKAKHAAHTTTSRPTATATAAAATTARPKIATVLQASDYDDTVATLPALAANDSNARATQSRNPIRRSHSERQQPLNSNSNSSRHHNGTANNNSNNKQQPQNGSSNNNNKNNRRRSSDNDMNISQQYSNSNSNSNNNNNNNSRDAILSFQDTMALRCRSNRNDSRDLFVRQSAGGVTAASCSMSRPREPPPPPPTPPPTVPTSVEAAANKRVDAASAKECNTAAQATKSDALSLAPQGQALADKGKNAVAVATKAAAKTTKVGENSKVAGKTLDKQQQQEQQREQTNAKQSQQLPHKGTTRQVPDNGANKDMQQMAATRPQQQQQQQKQKEKEHTHNNSKDSKDSSSNSACNATMCAITKPHDSGALTANSSAPGAKPQQRTVVRVVPFNKLATTSEVHRLKINHTDAEPTTSHAQHHQPTPTSPYSFQYSANGSTFSDATQKKTSILINGDDCYSTMNLSCDDASTPLYQSSVVVADYSVSTQCTSGGLKVTTTSNTVTINVSSSRSAEEELIYQHNKINMLLSRQAQEHGGGETVSGRAIIPIRGTPEVNLQRSASSTSSTSTSSMTSISSRGSSSGSGSGSIPKRGRTLIRLDYEKEKPTPQEQSNAIAPKADNTTTAAIATATATATSSSMSQVETPTTPLSHEEELLKILRNPVEAVKRNLVPHVCGRNEAVSDKDSIRSKKMQETANVNAALTVTATDDAEAKSKATESTQDEATLRTPSKTPERSSSFIAKLLEDPTLSQVADGLETETVAELIENSLKRLQESRSAIDMSGTKDSDDMNRLINLSLRKIKEERQNATANTGGSLTTSSTSTHLSVPTKDEDGHSNRGSISSANSFASANNYEMFDFDANESDCYQSCSSEITTPGDDDASSAATRSKFYQMLVDATLAEIEMSTNIEEDMDSHHYESIRNNGDPIYEEISDVPPPLPLTAPPVSDADMEKRAARSIFEGASKYDILSYLVDAKERGVVREEAFDYPLNCSNPIIIEEEACDTLSDLGKRKQKRDSSRASILSDSSEDNQSIMSSLSPPPNNFICGNNGGCNLLRKGAASDIERNDSGVGSETSKSSRSKYQNPLTASNAQVSKNSPIHLCEDCDGPVETQVTDSGIMFAPLVCRKCGKKRVERKEIITEIVETEEKYGRDLQIILEEFCHPMLVAGLLTQEQLSAIFLNTEELLENNQTLAERMRDALDIALEQGDDDLLTVNIGKIFLDFTQMLHAFESYCVRQAGASLLLANLEKEKELLRIFLKVSQMENAVLRRMNLNSFLMVPVQRVTKYPLLLARLYKVTPAHLEGRDQLKQAQEKIELHLNHINQEAKDVPTKLWRRISSSSPNRRASCEIDMINIKLRKMAIDILEWNHDEVRFAMEGKLLYTQPTDSNWKKARTIKLTPVNALLVTNGKPSANYKAEKVMSDKLNFPKHTGIREASLLVVKEKCGRYTLIREPLYLDRCVVCSEADWDDYFEVQEISSKDTFIFKAEDGVRTKQWYTQLQYHAQGMGAWRKRRNALANIMINGMLART